MGVPYNEEMLCDLVRMLNQFDDQPHTGTGHVVQSMFQKREEV